MRTPETIGTGAARSPGARPGRGRPGGGVRRGYSLIELLMVMAIGAALMGTTMATLFTLLRSEQAARGRLRQAMTLDRLAEQFRRDAHEADRVVASAQGTAPGAWEFRHGGGRTVEYRAGTEALLRLERVEGKIASREEYVLPAGALVSVGTQEGDQSDSPRGGKLDPFPSSRLPMAVLRIAAPAVESPGAPARTVRIEAALGLAYRFSAAKEGDDAPKP